MGLDMYLTGDRYAPSHGDNKRDVVDGYEVESVRLKMGYWRKFGPLHHFIVERFADGDDNCRPIGLSADDLIVIADALERGRLPENQEVERGCFFGSDEMWDEDRANGSEHAKVFRKAAEWVEKNSWYSVEYQASW